MAEARDCGCLVGYGHTHARLFTPPLRELTPETSAGFRVIAFATMLGLTLLPWQKWFLIHALELKPGHFTSDGPASEWVFRFSNVLLVVARQNGKTTIAMLVIMAWLSLFQKQTVVGAAQSLSMSEDIWDDVKEMYLNHPLLQDEVAREPLKRNGKMTLFLTGHRKYIPIAATRGAGRGQSVDGLHLDELREQRDYEAWGALSATTAARPNSQKLMTTNQGDVQSVVLNFMFDAAIEAIKEGTTDDSDTFLADYSAPMDMEPDDPEAMAYANPGMGRTIEFRTLKAEYETKPIGVYRTEHLSQKVDRLDAPYDVAAFTDSVDKSGTLRDAWAKRNIHVGLDVSPDGRHVGLVGVAKQASTGKLRAQVLKTWVGTHAVDTASEELSATLATIRPRMLLWSKTGPAGAMAPAVAKLRGVRVRDVSSEINASCMHLATVIIARRLAHSGQTDLLTQMLAAKKQVSGDGWRVVRKDAEAGHVNLTYALAFAASSAAGALPAAPLMFITAED